MLELVFPIYNCQYEIENGKTNGITNGSKLCEQYNSHKLEITTQLE